MYTSRGNNAYGQQSYAGQSAYGQNLGAGYPANAAGGPDGNAQLPMVSRHSAMLGGSEEVDANAYRPLPAAGAHYGGQYSSLYGSAALSTAPQAPAVGAKGAGSSVLESRGIYGSAKQDSPKFSSGEYIPASSHVQLYGEKGPDYSAIERRQFGRQSAYMGRDLQSESTGRFADSVGFGPQHQAEIYDRIDKAVLLRQEQLLKAHSLQSASLEGSARQADYLAARGASSRHPTQELTSFGGRMDDPRSLSMLSGSSYGELPAPSILGAAPRRNADDLLYSQNSSNPGYGVSLPPGRDYGSGKGLLVPSLESDYPISLSHGGHPRIDERKDDRASYLQEFELREEARRRDRLRERERDREREKEWDREREREREKERERGILERRLKERERDRKRAIDTRRERTPPRVSRDRRGSSLVKEGRALRRDSPHHEAAHRRHSPVKDKRREYVCKAYSFSLIDVERDYPSLNKRYPRLFIPSDFCKALVNWPRENLQLSIRTPVSFEHDFVEEDGVTVMKEPTTKLLAEQPAKSGCGNIVWNVKVILMSGISKNALEELSSERSSDDRIPHICNIIRFAILKKDRSFMTIGGPWNSTDGGDPSVDDSCLIQTAIRYGKDVAKIDLQNCKNWNRFLEIHYDRIGKDGFFSHKEVSVIFVPDLSECLPSLDAWRDQWLAHKKAVAERERQLSLRKERSRGKEVLKDKEIESSKQKRSDKEEKKKESASTGEAKQVKNKEQAASNPNGSASEGKGDMNDKKIEKDDSGGGEKGSETGKNASEVKGDMSDKKVEKKDDGGERGSETGKNASEGKDDMNEKKIEKKDDCGSERGKNEEKKEQVEAAEIQTPGSVKSGKKKIVRRVVKQKVVGKLATDSTTKQPDNVGEKDNNEGPKENPETPGEESSADPAGVQTFKRKRLVKKVLVAKAAQNEDNSDTKEKAEPSSGPAVQDTNAKTVVKKKIIKKVAKRKAADVEQSKKVDVDEKKVVGDETEEGTQKKSAGEEKPASEVTESGNAKESKTEVSAKQNDVVSPTKADTKDVKEDKKDEKRTVDKSGSVTKAERSKAKGGEKSKDEKDKREKDGKDESRAKSNKEVKETRKPEEPPRHPGLILQTKFSKESKLRSSSLSLDLLLDYTDKDIEESTFELSVFAETFYEMLQHQMGCRLLTFLQKLRIKFVTKRNQRKRQREEEIAEKANAKNSSAKRPKTDELPVKDMPAKSSETLTATQPDAVKQEEEKAITIPKESSTVDHVDEVQMEQVTDDEEDPEEDSEEYEPMEDGSPPHDPNENMGEDGKSNVDVAPGNEKDEVNVKEEKDVNAEETKAKPEADTCEKKEEKVDTGKKETPRAKEVVDKELLQAFRFFDRNQVGHIRVEDMRLIIHNLGKFLSHRDVKELVQSALIESNTARDDRILYKKLVRMTNI